MEKMRSRRESLLKEKHRKNCHAHTVSACKYEVLREVENQETKQSLVLS